MLNLLHTVNLKAYLEGMLINFSLCDYDAEKDHILFGKSGHGLYPNYKFQKPIQTSTLHIGRTAIEVTSHPSHTFSGRSHREMTWLDDHPWHPENWSDGYSVANIRELLSKLLPTSSKH